MSTATIPAPELQGAIRVAPIDGPTRLFGSLESALKYLAKNSENVRTLFRRHAEFTSPSERRREKAVKARARRKRAMRRVAYFEG